MHHNYKQGWLSLGWTKGQRHAAGCTGGCPSNLIKSSARKGYSKAPLKENPFFISSWTLITRKDGVPIRHFWLWWYLILLFVESNDVVSLSKGWVACSLSPSLVTVSSFLVNPLQLLDAKNNPEDFCFNQGMMQLPLTVVSPRRVLLENTKKTLTRHIR